MARQDTVWAVEERFQRSAAGRDSGMMGATLSWQNSRRALSASRLLESASRMGAGKILSIIAVSVLTAMIIGLWIAPQLREAEYQAAVAREREAKKMVGVASAEPTSSIHTRAAFIEREADGHYWTRADVQGTEVKFMVDTGASIVALTYRDAQRLGLSPETLTYDSEIRTAGGVTYGAPIMLDSIRIGHVEVQGVSAVVLRSELEQSLLGMTFLSELNSYEFRRGQLIIRQ